MIKLRDGGAIRPLLSYETRSAASLRLSYVLLGAAMLAVLSIVFLTGSADAGGGTPMGLDALLFAPMGFLAILLQTFGASRLGYEYRYRQVMLLHVYAPRRMVSYSAKLIFVTLVGASVVLVVLGLGVGLSFLSGYGTAFPSGASAPQWLSAFGRGALVAMFYAVAGLTLTALTRSFMWGVLLPIIQSTIMEPVAVIMLGNRLPWLTNVLPFSVARNVLGLGDGGAALGSMGGDVATQALFLVVWFVVLVALGGYCYARSES
jgi:hypothetical protein